VNIGAGVRPSGPVGALSPGAGWGRIVPVPTGKPPGPVTSATRGAGGAEPGARSPGLVPPTAAPGPAARVALSRSITLPANATRISTKSAVA